MVIELIKVNRGKYNKLRQDPLALYAQMIVSKTSENATYSEVAVQVAELKEKSLAYDAALLAAAQGGKELVFLKNQAKETIVILLDCLVNVAEVFAKGDDAYLVGMGFEVRQKGTRSRLPLVAPEMPIRISVRSTRTKGELEVTFQLPNREHVVTVAVEYRIAGSSEPFANGLYMETETMVLTGLPQLQMVEVRFRSLGRELLKSGWTSSIIVPVL
jgi:hypothetical protein